MATSGSFAFDPTFASILDEAAERAGMDPASLNQKHITSARNSLNYMLVDWAARDGDPLYRIDTVSTTVASGTNTLALAAGAYDVLDLMIDVDQDNNERHLRRVSRQDYLSLTDKTEVGDPTMYYVDMATLNTPTITFWPTPNSTISVRYDYMRYHETLGALSETLDVHRPWLEAIVSGLALRLAEKYNMERVGYLMPKAEAAYQTARRAGSGNSRIVIAGRGFGRSRTLRSSA